MVVHDEKTRKAALELIEQGKRVFYTDDYRYSSVVESPEDLDSLIQRAFNRGDIAIVAESIDTIPYHSWEKKRVLQLRRQQEMKNAREWVKTHPKEAARLMEQV